MNISCIPKVSTHSVPCTNKLHGLVVNSPNITLTDVNEGKWTGKVRDMTVGNQRMNQIRSRNLANMLLFIKIKSVQYEGYKLNEQLGGLITPESSYTLEMTCLDETSKNLS